MFHFWFNTFFVRGEEELLDLQNGSLSSQINSATAAPTPHGANLHPHSHFNPLQHRPIASSVSVTLPPSLSSQQHHHPSVSHTISYNSYADRRQLSSHSHPLKSATDQPSYQHQQLQSSLSMAPHPIRTVSGATFYQPRDVHSVSTANSSAPVRHGDQAPHTKTYRTLTLKKKEIDKANKDKQHKSFQEKFQVSTQVCNSLDGCRYQL